MASSTESGVVGIQMADNGSLVENRPTIERSSPHDLSCLNHRKTTGFRVILVEIELPNVFQRKTSLRNHFPIVPLRRAWCHPSHCLCRLSASSAPMTMRRVAPVSTMQHGASAWRAQCLGGSSLPSSTYSRTHPLTRPVRRRIEIRLGIVIRPKAMSPKAQTSSSE